MPEQADVIRALFKEIFDEDFDPNNQDHKKMLQSSVYLLENMGVHVGEYSFLWDSRTKEDR